jgi:hypothetical protein
MIDKDLIIGAYSGDNPVPPNIWANSIIKSGFSGDIVLIALDTNPEVISLLNDRVKIVHKSIVNDFTDVYSQRFYHIYNYLKLHNIYRYVIVTDVTDVIFQSDPSKFIEKNIGDKSIISNGESILIKNEKWHIDNIISGYGEGTLDEIKDYEVQNVGVVAGKQKQVASICNKIYSMAKVCFSHPADQTSYNIIIRNKPFKDITHFWGIGNGWSVNAGVIACPPRASEFDDFLIDEKPIIENDSIKNSVGQEVVVVHQYNRNNDWLKLVYKKFN